jgi:hypothetical protein
LILINARVSVWRRGDGKGKMVERIAIAIYITAF